MKIAVVDGQGGGIGKRIVEILKSKVGSDYEIIALGTNALATSNMIRAGAMVGATGENAIKVTAQRVDYIIGPIAIVMANAMMGEITPLMAEHIASSPAKKILVPLNKCNTEVVGTKSTKLNDLLEMIVDEL